MDLCATHDTCEAEFGRFLTYRGWRVIRESYKTEPWDMEAEAPDGRIVHFQFKTRSLFRKDSKDVTLDLKHPEQYDQFVAAGNELYIVTDHYRIARWDSINNRSDVYMWTRHMRDNYWFLRDEAWGTWTEML